MFQDASLVLSTQANATIVSIDPSAALSATGVVKFYSAKDLPQSVNMQAGPVINDEEFFASTQVQYVGQGKFTFQIEL